MRRPAASLACAFPLLLLPARVLAADVGTVGSKPVQLEVTETSIVAQHFDPRAAQGQAAPSSATVDDSGWGQWINRLDAALRWDSWSAGLRLDSAVYWRRPADNPDYATQFAGYQAQTNYDNESRFQNSIYPAKLWLSFTQPGLEITAGDSYVQFGRGLTLSMRKVDELGIDTTVRGAKVELVKDPFAVTVVGGFANPSRVDEATGRSLWVTSNLVAGDPRVADFGSDRLVGVDLQAGRGLPVTLSTHAVQFTRCAPYHYQGANVDTDFSSDPGTVMFGTCDTTATDTWLSSLNTVPRGLQAHDHHDGRTVAGGAEPGRPWQALRRGRRAAATE